MCLAQRYGRVDRIGSPHQRIVLRCCFPDRDLEHLLNPGHLQLIIGPDSDRS